MTAAHCIWEFQRQMERPLLTENLQVKLGKQSMNTTADDHERTVMVERVIVHPGKRP